MSAELEDVKALIEEQGKANTKRFDETGERLDKLVAAMQHATNVQQEHDKRIEAIERGNEEREQRMTRAESSAAVLGERLGQMGERLQTTQSSVEAQGKVAAANAKEMEAQTQTLKEIREGQVKRDGLLEKHLGLLDELRDDKLRREEREKVEKEAADKEAAAKKARDERIDRGRNYTLALVGTALTVLGLIFGWLWHREQSHATPPEPPAAVAPAAH